MIMCFSFLILTSSLKPVFIITEFGESPIYSRIKHSYLYPECPSYLDSFIIQSNKKFNTNILSRYPKCVAKLLRIQFNTSTSSIQQLPGIKTESTLISNTSILSDSFDSILNKIKQLGYQDNINLFSVGYNYFFHPVSSFLVYDELKKKIEEVFTSTGEKSVIICTGEGSSFSSIFLSNYSNSEWVRQYIDTSIFLSPTFAGSPSITNLISQSMPPFISNSEFKKSFMRLPFLYISLPNYAIFKDFTISPKLNKKFSNKNASHIFELLKDLRKIDNETEAIFKECIEKYLKVPVPEPPVSSIILYNDKTAKTAINSIISADDKKRNEETVLISAQYACTNWKTVKCIKSDEPSQFIFEYLNGRTSKKQIKPKEDIPSSLYVSISGTQDIYADSGYVTSHTIETSKFSYDGPEGATNYPLSNAFDNSPNTYYISSIANSATFNNTIEITFSENMSLEAFLYDPAYSSSGSTRTFHGFPTLLYAYTKSGNNPYSLSAIFSGTPVYPWTRIQFVFPKCYFCDKLKLEFVEVTKNSFLNSSSPSENPDIGGLIFIRHLFISSEDIYSNTKYLNPRLIDKSEFTYTASESMPNHPISNAFDGNTETYYISSSESNNNYVEIIFQKPERIEAFLYDIVKEKVGTTVIFQGFPTKMNVYASLGTNQYELVSYFEGSAMDTWNRTCYHLFEIIECDRLKIEFIEVTSQTVDGNSMCPVISGLHFIRFYNETEYTTPSFNHSSNGFLNEYSISPSKFTFDGTEGLDDNHPLSNAFDGDVGTYYISSIVSSATDAPVVTINFIETVSIEFIVYDTSYSSINNVLYYNGYPKIMNVYSSVGGQPFELVDIFRGIPHHPTSKIEFHFTNIIQCDKLKLEFVDVATSTIVNQENSKYLIVGNLYFISPDINIDGYPIEPAFGQYTNDTYVQSIKVDVSEFTYKTSPGFSGFPDTNIFDGNINSYYISSVPNNSTYKGSIEIQFNEIVYLEAFLIDPNYFVSGTIYTYRGYPTGLKVYSSVENEPYSLFGFYFGEPVYPWKRIQYVFKDFIRCDKLKLEFTHLTFAVVNGTYYESLSLADLYLLHAQIPATPLPSTPSSSVPVETPVPTFTPSQIPTQSFKPTEIPISDICQEGKHCKYEGSEDHQILVTINTTVFTSIQSDENGGALFIQNVGIVCTNITFKECQTKLYGNGEREEGGGGGIYIKNDLEIKNEISLSSVNFTNCKASYGGAVYIYSSYYESTVTINSCFFSSNQATSSSENGKNSDQMIGGAAIFISSKSSVISDCTFNKNIGEGQLKMQNKFNENDQKSNLLSSNQPRTSNVIKACRFVIGRQSKSSIYYMSGENGVLSTVRNSNFIGDLFTGNYHINGMSTSKFSPKLVVVACKFSSDYTRAFNTKGDNDYINMVFQKQTFNYDENIESSSNNNDNLIFEIVGSVVVVAILIIIIVFVVRKRGEIAKLGNVTF